MALTRLNNRSVSAVTSFMDANAITGKVLQSVTAGPTVKGSTTSTNWVQGHIASITPTSATSKILVQLTGQIGSNRNGDQLLFVSYVERNVGGSGTDITLGYSAYSNTEYVNHHYRYVNSSNAWYGGMYSLARLDSPNTTSQVDYKFFYKNYGSQNDVHCGGMTFVLTEIAG